MIYHLVSVFREQFTGQKHAALNRFKMFKNAGIKSKFITVFYEPRMYDIMKGIGVNRRKYKNLYNHFQHAENIIKRKVIHIRSLFPKELFTMKKILVAGKPHVSGYKIFEAEKQVAYARLFNGIIDLVIYYDEKNKKKKIDYYDCRGFLSSEKIFDQDENVSSETYYTPKGKIAIETIYQNIDGKTVPNSICLAFKGKKTCFDSFDSLVTFYLENILNKKDIVIVDTNPTFNKPLNQMKTQIRKIAVLHNRHIENNNALTDEIADDYKNLFNALPQYRAIISLTEKQRQDIINRFNNEKQVIVIPHALSKHQRKNSIKINPETNPPKVISVARYEPQKRIEDSIKAFSKVVKEVPDATLHLLGYGTLEKELNELIHELKLENSVKLCGYTTNMHDEYISAKLKIVSSRYEGFHLGILEAISYGIPVVSYDIRYGPSDMIDNGISGFLTSENPEELAEKIITLLKDKELCKNFSENAYKKSFDFSEEEFIKKWKQLLKELNNK